ncbi:ATP-binding cassette domain-containing protein [Pseudomonas sichuanensis]|uniref:ATP-binding cassette domain-containing protein n=1 Tax=Pseudomonas sichuanensis TaxID=2213015 RepID=UPI00215FED55|nr:ATP-binding cassette domain-containing protein [Pseudomonas sichuanensis]UVL90124.1 ATP-binding cassette domain-containing protein [Pseudomonas sichuanensis]
MQGSSKERQLVVTGAKTNNLKNLNVAINLNTITAITGISGGGKSSLAYGTIFSICKQQFSQLEHGSYDHATYSADSFHGALPAVALTQNNFNSNPKSTIYSYLDIPSYLYSIAPSTHTNIDQTILRLNKPGNECSHCGGSRHSFSLCEDLLVDHSKSLEKMPFKCWTGANLSKHGALLRAFCEDEGIDLKKTISELPISHRKKLLTGESSNKFRISFTFSGKRRTREERYVGPMKILEQCSQSNKISEYDFFRKFSKPSPCIHCESTGIDRGKFIKSKLYSISLFDLIRLPVSDLAEKLKKARHSSSPPLNSLIRQLDTLIELDLGYLTLARQIPSLSGGELQKLRFAQICNTQISGILFVLDEISSQVSKNHHLLLIQKMKEICDRGNTIVMIEHNDFFISAADNIICVGPAPGDEGGYIVPYTPPPPIEPRKYENTTESDLIPLPKVSNNNVKDISASIPKNSLTAVCGVSGSGKSSFALAISQALPQVNYVSQKQMRGNIRSTISTALDLSNTVAGIYSKITGVSKDFFLLQPGKAGCCIECGGTGLVEFSRSFEKTLKISCPTCDGASFSNEVDDFRISELNIKDLYSRALHSFPKEVLDQSKKIASIVKISEALGISHLSIGRKIGSLSGGESRRVKLLQALISPNKEKILIIDEPGAGLDSLSATKAIGHIHQYAKLFKAILVIDHKPEILNQCEYLLEFGPGAGPDGGKIVYAGPPAFNA